MTSKSTKKTLPPPIKKPFGIPVVDLQTAIDVDDSRGRSVPINMNFIEEGYLTKDTGISLFGAVDMALRHSLYYFKKKDGTNFVLSAVPSGATTKLQKYDFGTGAWVDVTFSNVFTVTIASPGVFTFNDHGLAVNDTVTLSTTGALPTGLLPATTYHVIAAGFTANTFQLSTTSGGAAINTSGTQSGVHTITFQQVFTTGAEFGFSTYNDDLYGCNAVEPYFKYTGTTYQEYPLVPKGNIMEVFEDRMFISGVTLQPLTSYYSGVGTPTVFGSSDIINPLGTDFITNLKNYYGTLIVFKQESIWKVTFQYDQVVALFIPKLELQSNNYGACSRKSVTWVENDLWFFTGREVRSIGYKDNQTGVFGVNNSVISENIKETLAQVSTVNFSKCAVYYSNRRFYLAVPLSGFVNDTVFVCHLLYKKAWTKYTGRDKARVNDFLVVNEVMYTTVSSGNYGAIKWEDTALNDISSANPIASEVFFRRVEDKEFNKFRIYRYLDLDFKALSGIVTATIRSEHSDVATIKSKAFFVGTEVEGEENTLGEIPSGESLVADAFGETVYTSPFIKKRVSFLSKAQSIIIGLSNANADETFTIAQFEVRGIQQPFKLFSSRKIVSM